MKNPLLPFIVFISFLGSSIYAQAEEIAAKLLFGAASTQAPFAAQSYGGYAKGCLAGAMALPVQGEYWQVMRLSRNRNWGHPRLISFLQNFAQKAHENVGWHGLMVGDLSQPRGGPMLTGHKSHQSGLDADIWFYEMPERRLSYDEREKLSAISMIKGNSRKLNNSRWSKRHYNLVKTAAQFPEVARIFVFPAIKKALCDAETSKTAQGRAWLGKIRPWYGHHYHFHIRLTCKKGDDFCENQSPPPKGDGCGKDLDWWLSDAPWTPKKRDPNAPPPKPKLPLTLKNLPQACTQIAQAQNGEWDASKKAFGFTAPPDFGIPPSPRRRP